MDFQDTIAAISTPPGEGGIGIVRISGPRALEIADRLFKGKVKPSLSPTYTVHYGHIVHHGETLDEVIITVMRKPKSYTREDVVEINCHGGIVPLRKVLEAVLSSGARMAKPGEFTLRAFLNGRIDLAQAEAVLDIIRAKSELSLKIASSQLEGNLSRSIRRIKENLLHLIASLEASLDFPEEEIEIISREETLNKIKTVREAIASLLKNESTGRVIREGALVTIAGKPNVGKSTLLNQLLGKDRAIVTEVPGTTRDALEEWLTLEGVPFRLVDTAGIRKVKEAVEKEGVKRSEKYLESADIVLLVLDISRPLNGEDEKILEKSRDKNRLLVINKIDLQRKWDPSTLAPEKVEISALQGKGIEELKKKMLEKILQGEVLQSEGVLVTNLRHVELLKNALSQTEKAEAAAKAGLSEEFVSRDLQEALSALKSLLGEEVGEEILDNIFSRFCIGK
ncbi:MAG: tRNA uridine-5-carboxymethylaminomethyl(34) synthesis GTPase MnmE [Caldiserica bacterium]|nr:tRNA uridine-5-carboxymethylaminomethyl(34) synthesis GTPase MnmE [Caldisericota bacterium]